MFVFAFPSNAFASGDLVINEIMAEPDGGGEWVELYFTNSSFELKDYYFKDAKNNKKNIQDVQNCGNFAVFELSSTTYWLNNDTSSDKESIILYNQFGTEIDSRIDWDNPGKGKTLGRTPDGSATWNETESPTKCASNSSAKVESSEPTNNSSSNSPSPSSTTTQYAPKSSPKASPKSSPKASPSSTTAKKEVLGEKTGSPEATPSINSFITPAPSTAPSFSESKIANFALGGGAILVVLSIGGYLWYKWEIKKSSKEVDKDE